MYKFRCIDINRNANANAKVKCVNHYLWY